MDRPNLQWAVHGPTNYITAWDHIRCDLQPARARPTWAGSGARPATASRSAAPRLSTRATDEVDWVCADVYTFCRSQSLAAGRRAVHEVRGRAPASRCSSASSRSNDPPVVLGQAGSPRPGSSSRSHPQIKGIAYFDANGTDSNGNPFKYWLGGHQQAIDVVRAAGRRRRTSSLPSRRDDATGWSAGQPAARGGLTTWRRSAGCSGQPRRPRRWPRRARRPGRASRDASELHRAAGTRGTQADRADRAQGGRGGDTPVRRARLDEGQAGHQGAGRTAG